MLSELLSTLVTDASGSSSWGSSKSKLPCSICELCRFHVQYSGSPMWTALCGLLNRALQVWLIVLVNVGLCDRLGGHWRDLACPP